MKQPFRVNRKSLLLVLCTACIFSQTGVAYADKALLSTGGTDAGTAFIQQMIGEWEVRQRMWPSAAGQAVELAPAVAHRLLIGSTIVQETMTLAPESSETPFTRLAYFDYNAISQRFEYFSLDTRAPQMMNERSLAAAIDADSQRGSAIALYGGIFVAPQWGESKNVPFRYRIVLSRIEMDEQTMRLYLKAQSGSNTKEFLAFEYVYTRKH